MEVKSASRRVNLGVEALEYLVVQLPGRASPVPIRGVPSPPPTGAAAFSYAGGSFGLGQEIRACGVLGGQAAHGLSRFSEQGPRTPASTGWRQGELSGSTRPSAAAAPPRP
jgi:hypothetical protein